MQSTEVVELSSYLRSKNEGACKLTYHEMIQSILRGIKVRDINFFLFKMRQRNVELSFVLHDTEQVES